MPDLAQETPASPSLSPPKSDAAALNQLVYDRMPSGHLDYWRLMAAPRFRMQVILDALATRAPHRIADLGCGTGLLLA